MNTLRVRRERFGNQLHYRSNNFGRLRIINHFSVSTDLIIVNPLKVNYPDIASLGSTTHSGNPAALKSSRKWIGIETIVTQLNNSNNPIVRFCNKGAQIWVQQRPERELGMLKHLWICNFQILIWGFFIWGSRFNLGSLIEGWTVSRVEAIEIFSTKYKL